MSATLGAALAGQVDASQGTGTGQDAALPRVARFSAAAGVDRWSDSTIPLESFRLYLDDDLAGERWRYSWSLTSDLAMWGLRGALDQHAATISARPDAAWGISTSLSGSFLLRWGDVHALGTWTGSLGRLGLRAGVGPDLRWGEQGLHPGARAQVDLSLAPAPELNLMLTYGTTLLGGAELPGNVQDLDLIFSWSPGRRTLVLLGLGALASLDRGVGPAEDPSAWLAGLPPANSVSVRQTLVAEHTLSRLFFVRAELGVQEFVASSTLPHAIALGGAGVRLYRPPVGPPVGAGPFPVLLSVHAPTATRVEVIGSFTGWVPVPMWGQQDGSWTMALTLPAGQYEYCFLVDGVATVPPDGELRRDDGFGGFNAVLIVPRAAVVEDPLGGSAAIPTLQSP